MAWEELREFLKPKDWNSSTRFSGPRPPKQSAKIYLIIAGYSQKLFKDESYMYPHYPPNPNFPHWLNNLAQRVVEHVLRVVGEIGESDAEKSFAYHELKESGMRRAIFDAMTEYASYRYQVKLSETILFPNPSHKPIRQAENALEVAKVLKAPSEPNPVVSDSLKVELKKLLVEARWRADDIAEKIGIGTRNVYRHLSGETKPSLSNIDNYEKALSKKLNRIIKLPTS